MSRPRVSYIITTHTGDADASGQRVPHRNHPYRKRIKCLINEVIPAAKNKVDELIVGGRVAKDVRDEHPDVRYLHVPAIRKDRAEALHIREICTRHATGDVLIYTPDDHKLGLDFVPTIRQTADEGWDVLTPRRIHGKTGDELPTGKSASHPYSALHGQVLKRDVWARVPWTSVDTVYVDVPLSRIWEEQEFEMIWPDEPYVVDVESGENEL